MIVFWVEQLATVSAIRCHLYFAYYSSAHCVFIGSYSAEIFSEFKSPYCITRTVLHEHNQLVMEQDKRRHSKANYAFMG